MIAPAATHRARGQAGFTLVEVMVAMVAGLIVTAAMFAILEVSLRQTSRITDRVQATQLGRAALSSITGELDSACLAREFAPVQEASKPKELRFISGYSEQAEIKAAEVTEHRITWTGEAVNGKYPPKEGNLVDTTYSVSGTWPKFATTGTKTGEKIVAENIWPIESPSGSKTYIPVFQYEKYAAKPAATEATEASTGLERYSGVSESTGLGKAEAASTAAVLISFTTIPTNKYKALDRPVEFSNRVGFALAAPAAEATIKSGPCQ